MTLDDACKMMPAAREARAIAEEAHAGQLYGDKPYMWHLEQVAAIVFEHRGELGDWWVNAVAVAFLHDLIEDRPERFPLMLGRVSNEIINRVQALSKCGESNREYFAGIREAGTHTVAVKIADRIANLRACRSEDMGDPKKLARYRSQREAFAAMKTPGELDPMWVKLDEAYGDG